MTIRLRPHHLLCMLTYVGKGYTAAFTTNYNIIMERLLQGEDILIISGPDDLCAPLLDQVAPHCFRESVIERDLLAARDISKLLACRIETGSRITLDPKILHHMRRGFANGALRTACTGCEWNALCNSVAINDYDGVHIRM